jgi:predicted Zn-dependent peptidase
MAEEHQETIELPNGLQIILEQVPNVRSVAYNLLIPGGIVCDAEETLGSAHMLADLVTRGAGGRDSRALSEAFENSGIRHGEGASQSRFIFRGSLLEENIETALSLVADMVMRPMLPEEEVESIRQSCLQDLESIKDNPAQQTMIRLCERYYPAPFNRPGEGTPEGIETVTPELLQAEWEKRFGAKGAVLSIAGSIDIPRITSFIELCFGEWNGEAEARPQFGELPTRTPEHTHLESAQTQIALAYPGASFLDDDYYCGRLVAGILSGGMFGRLFIEIREKRGLCYSVYARHSAGRECGTLVAYAGTTPDRAQETLEVLVEQLRELRGSISVEELERARANILSAMIMGEESTGSRAVSNASDQWLLGRVRGLDEIKQRILSVTLEDIDRYLEKFPAEDMLLQTSGPSALTTSLLENGAPVALRREER